MLRDDMIMTSREQLEDLIEKAIEMLDLLDGDLDWEDDGTAEPSLGWTKTMSMGNSEDLEEFLIEEICTPRRGMQ